MNNIDVYGAWGRFSCTTRIPVEKLMLNVVK
jgi:hypothetical protein